MTRSNIQQANKGDLKAVKTKEQSDTRVEGIKPIDNYYKHLTSHQRLLIWMGT